MRKFFITLTVLALVISIVGTGVIVYIDSSTPLTDPTLAPSVTVSGE